MDSGYQDILPYIRPRAGDLGWLGLLMASLIIALLAGALLTYLTTGWRRRRRTRLAFFAAAAERRLSIPQTTMLYDLSRRHRMHDPLLLLTSLKIFDDHAGRLAAGGGDRTRLNALGAVRRRLGFDTPAVEQRFYTTRTLAPGQKLMVWPNGLQRGFIQCVVVGRDERAITAVPLRRDDDELLSQLQAGEKIKVLFWRDGDTEYRFRTDILEFQPHTTSVRIRHAEELERVQQRDFYRIHVDMHVRLYALPLGIEEIDPERVASVATDVLEADLMDLSGGGLSLFLPGPAPRNAEIVIDPVYEGVFPLAAAHLLIVDQQRQGNGWHVRLQFTELPAAVRDDLVAAIFDYELSAAR